MIDVKAQILAMLEQHIVGDGQGYPHQSEREAAAEAIAAYMRHSEDNLVARGEDVIKDAKKRERERAEQIIRDLMESLASTSDNHPEADGGEYMRDPAWLAAEAYLKTL